MDMVSRHLLFELLKSQIEAVDATAKATSSQLMSERMESQEKLFAHGELVLVVETTLEFGMLDEEIAMGLDLLLENLLLIGKVPFGVGLLAFVFGQVHRFLSDGVILNSGFVSSH